MTLAGDGRVVDRAPLPLAERPGERRPVIAQRQCEQAGLAGRAAEREVRGELLHLVHGHLVVGVERVGESCRQLHRRVDGERAADAVTQPGALQECRRLDGSAADEHVAGAHDAASSRTAEVHRHARGVPLQALGALADHEAGAGACRPGEVGAGHALTLRARSVRGVGHPPGDLVVLPAEPIGAAVQHLARRRRRARERTDGQLALHLVGDGQQLVDVPVGDLQVHAPALQQLARRSAVEAAVDLRAPAGAAALGVGDRRTAERHRHPAIAVLAVHLLEGERHDAALFDPLAFFDHEHVEAGLGEERGRGRAAGPGADDHHLGRRRCAVQRRHGPTTGVVGVSGQCSQMYA